jgi:predicted nucleic acid-binding Zn ribbon protein
MSESEVTRCPKCGKTISDKGAKYCPYCAEPLGKLRHRRNKAVFWWGAAFTLIGAVIVVLVQPRMDYSRGPFAGTSIELWFAGVMNLIVGIGFIVYGYHLRKHEVELARGTFHDSRDEKDETPSEPESDFAKLFKEEKRRNSHE